MSAHSPGPWVVSCGSIAGMSRELDDNSLVVITGRDAIAVFSGSEETREANAKLVAAAPDLLAELRTAVAVIEQLAPKGLNKGVVDLALLAFRAAIARAEGRTT